MLGKSFEYICNANIISTLDTIESYVLTFAGPKYFARVSEIMTLQILNMSL